MKLSHYVKFNRISNELLNVIYKTISGNLRGPQICGDGEISRIIKILQKTRPKFKRKNKMAKYKNWTLSIKVDKNQFTSYNLLLTIHIQGAVLNHMSIFLPK